MLYFSTKQLRFVFLCMGALLLLAPPTIKADDFSIVGAPWCPYTCEDPSMPGLLVEASQIILDKLNHSSKYTQLPWLRAQEMVHRGDIDMIAGISHSMIKDEQFHFSKTPIYFHQLCLYQHPQETDILNNFPNKSQLTFGFIENYNYSNHINLEHWIDKNADNIVSVYGQHFLHERLVKLLLLSRINFFAEDPNIISWHNYQNDIKQATCLQPTQGIFMGFSKKLPNYKKLSEQFDQELKKFKDTEQFSKLLNKYSIKGKSQ